MPRQSTPNPTLKSIRPQFAPSPVILIGVRSCREAAVIGGVQRLVETSVVASEAVRSVGKLLAGALAEGG
jgi:hypothetical protein